MERIERVTAVQTDSDASKGSRVKSDQLPSFLLLNHFPCFPSSPPFCPPFSSSPFPPCLVYLSSPPLLICLAGSIDAMIASQFESGNLPSSMGNGPPPSPQSPPPPAPSPATVSCSSWPSSCCSSVFCSSILVLVVLPISSFLSALVKFVSPLTL
eukprot:767004-Hanusia_phi.AAC.8